MGGKLNEDINDVKLSTGELVQMARNDVHAQALEVGKQSLDDIKKLSVQAEEMKVSFDARLEGCDQNMTELKADLSDAMNDMNIVKEDINETKKELDNVKESLSKLAETLQNQNRVQRIEWALSNISSVVENFQFKGLSTPVPQLSDSHALVRKVLMAFREGAGLY